MWVDTTQHANDGVIGEAIQIEEDCPREASTNFLAVNSHGKSQRRGRRQVPIPGPCHLPRYKAISHHFCRGVSHAGRGPRFLTQARARCPHSSPFTSSRSQDHVSHAGNGRANESAALPMPKPQPLVFPNRFLPGILDASERRSDIPQELVTSRDPHGARLLPVPSLPQEELG